MSTKHRAYCESPIGLLEITGGRSGIESVSFVERRKGRKERSGSIADVPQMLQECASQLKEYFEGSRKTFELRLAPSGTVFQKRVWKALLGIPWGRTKSYRDVARTIGSPLAARAVGGANHRNRIVVVIPCHRVVGSDGQLTGYGGGLWRKEWLLAHEARPGRSPVGETRRGRTGRPRRHE
jgi:methylated-DNA-[protein]-cysteine S-methyltransferase